MPVPVEVLFERHVRRKHPRGWADLEQPKKLGLTAGEVSVLVLVRDMVNLALANAKIVPDHVVSGPYHFDYVDAADESAESFSGDGYSFIGLTIPMAKSVFRACERLRSSAAVWQFVGVNPASREANSFQLVLVLLAFLFIVTHEYCHHVLGHQPDAIPQGDARTASLRGNLQAQTREVAADGYAALHLYEHVIHGGFRPQMVTLLSLENETVAAQDRIMFLCVLTAVASTLFRRPPDVLNAQGVYLLKHPPRAARLAAYMEHAMMWCRESHPSLAGSIDGQYFANVMATIGLAVCDNLHDADSSAQNAFMRSLEGQEYSRRLFENLRTHKGLMGS